MFSWESKRGSTPTKTIQPTLSTHSLQERKESSLISRWARCPAEFEDLVLQTGSGHDYRKPMEQATQNPHVKSWLVVQPVSFSIWFIMGGEWHQQPPIGLENLSSIRRKRQSTHPFGEETKTRCLRIKKSEIKEPGIEIPFICLENHWFTHEVLLGWFQPHTVVVWHWDFSDLRHDAPIPLISRSLWDSIFFSEVPFLSQSTKLQKSHRNYQT